MLPIEIVELSGRLNGDAVPAFEARVTAALAGGATRLLVDCTALSYIASAGLRVMLLTAKQQGAAGGALVLCGLQPLVREVFDISGFTEIIAIEPDRAAAIASLATPSVG